MWLKLSLDALMWADPRGKVMCSSAQGTDSISQIERAGYNSENMAALCASACFQG